MDLADKALGILNRALLPNTYLVDIFPVLRYLPDWLPGMTFKETGRELRKVIDAFLNKPYEFVKYQMVLSLDSM